MSELVAYQAEAPPIALFGVSFDNVTAGEAIARIERMIVSRRPHYAVTANVDFLAQAQKDIELHRILLDADLVLCDGTPLVWASQMFGNPLPERVAGADIVPELIRLAARKGHRLFFLGAARETAERAVEKLRREHPTLSLDCYSPPFGSVLEMDHGEIARRILRVRPDLLFVALGCPKQEKWIAMHYKSLNVPVSIGVGGTVDFLAGQLRRAPLWMQRTGTEWVFRLAQEPRRLTRRYFNDLRVFGSRLLAQWWRLQFSPRRRRMRSNERVQLQNLEGLQAVTLPARWDVAAVIENQPILKGIMSDVGDCVVNSGGVEFLDSTGVASLIALQKKLRAANRQFVLAAPSRAVQRALRLTRLEHYFAFAPDVAAARNVILERSSGDPLGFAAASSSTTQVYWRGEITAANAAHVWEFTRARMTLASSREFVIDLSEVRFIDSSGLGVMVRAKKLSSESGCELSFASLSPAVRNVVRIARLEEFLFSGPENEHRLMSHRAVPITAT